MSIAILCASEMSWRVHSLTFVRLSLFTDCPSVFCPWNCERYIDSNGCLFCGKCQPKMGCPAVSCPNTSYFQCFPSAGRDGCTVCKCRVKLACPLTPMCSTNCYLATGPNGCEHCVCPPRKPEECPSDLQETATCPQPDCTRELGPDGCYHCRCPNDVDACPDVKCDPKCKHVIDRNTGCATGCQCNPNDI